MKLSVLFLVSCFLCSACNRESDDDTYIKAKVIITSDISCHTPVLSFEEDAAKVKTISNENNIEYGVIGLSDSLNMQNKKLYVLIKKLDPKNEFVCNALGLAYPHLEIIDAKER